MHLVRPDVGARHRLRGRGDGRIDIAALEEEPPGRRIRAQRVREVVAERHAGPRLPAHDELAHRLLGLLLARRDHADEVADHDDADDAGNVRDRRLVDRLQQVADEFARVDAGVGRPHDAAVQHAGQAHVVHEDRAAGGLGGDVDARNRCADDAVVGWRLRRRVGGEHELDVPAVEKRAVADAVCGVARVLDDAVLHRERRRIAAEHGRRLPDQPRPCLCRPLAQGRGMELDRRAGDGGALVGHERGVAEDDVDLRDGHVELLGDDLRERGAQTGAEIDVAAERGDTAVAPHREQRLVAFGRVGVHGRRLAGIGRRCRWHGPAHEQHAVRVEQVPPRARRVGATCHGAGSAEFDMRSAASCTASRISTCVPQRQRLCESASRTCRSLGCGVRCSSATVETIMPLRQ